LRVQKIIFFYLFTVLLFIIYLFLPFPSITFLLFWVVRRASGINSWHIIRYSELLGQEQTHSVSSAIPSC